jgi:DnaJ-class molecular chaperone
MSSGLRWSAEDDRCTICSGRGHYFQPGFMIVFEVVCYVCRGTGIKPAAQSAGQPQRDESTNRSQEP